MNLQRYQVVPYSKDRLIAFFVSGGFKTTDGCIGAKPQITYLDEYCAKLGIKTLLYESEYIDRHFSEDFAGYYVRCFDGYKKQCSRLHLFTSAFSETDVLRILTEEVKNSNTKDWSKELGYNGFVVIKPLPETVIGRTYGRTAGSDSRPGQINC